MRIGTVHDTCTSTIRMKNIHHCIVSETRAALCSERVPRIIGESISSILELSILLIRPTELK